MEGILDQINDAVRQVESKENTCDGECSMRQTVEEIQAGKLGQITSPFLLVMQTARQRELLVKYDNTVMLMDAIYKTCKYNFPCFFLTVKTTILLPLSFPRLKLKRCFHKASNSEKLDPDMQRPNSKEVLQSITTAPWYTTNTKLQEYLQSEWFSCKQVSVFSLYKYKFVSHRTMPFLIHL